MRLHSPSKPSPEPFVTRRGLSVGGVRDHVARCHQVPGGDPLRIGFGVQCILCQQGVLNMHGDELGLSSWQEAAAPSADRMFTGGEAN